MKHNVSYEETVFIDDEVYEEEFDFIDLVSLVDNEDPLSLDSH